MASAPTRSGDGIAPVARRLHYTFNSATRTIYTPATSHTTAGTSNTFPLPASEESQFAFFDAEHINFARVTVRKIIIPWVEHNVLKNVNDKVGLAIYLSGLGSVETETATIPPGLYKDSEAIWDAIETAFAGSKITLSVHKATAAEVAAQALRPDPNPLAAVGHPALRVHWGHRSPSIGPVTQYWIIGTSLPSTSYSSDATTAYRALGISAAGATRLVPAGGTTEGLLIADTPADPWQGVRSLNVECNLSFGHMYSTTRNRLVPVVERVPIIVGQPGANVIYEPPVPSAFLVESFSTMSLIKFEVRDNLNRVVDLHNLDWSIEFIVEEL